MAQETTVKGRMGRLQRLLARLISNREELQHLEPSRLRFEAVIAQMQEAADRQAGSLPAALDGPAPALIQRD